MAVLGYLAKLKWGLGLVLVHIFCMIFHKNVPYLIVYQWTKFQCYSLFLSQDAKQNVLLSSYVDS